MSLHPMPIGEIPVETARIARAAFPKGTLVTRLRDAFSELYKDEDFKSFYPKRGQPGLAMAAGLGDCFPVSGASE
jgi:transposase